MCEFCKGDTRSVMNAANETRKVRYFVLIGRQLHTANDYAVSTAYMDANFCPMCGRDLRGESDGRA